MIERWWLRIVIYTLGLLRWTMGHQSRAYALLTLRPIQSFLEWVGRLRAREVFLKARDECPAYRSFLSEQLPSGGPRRWQDVPVTTKENYVKQHSVEARCFGGALTGRGEMIDESSGSSGLPNNWVRSAAERKDVRRLLQLNYDLMYGDRPRMLLNCFALGPWATGMNVSMSLADVGVLKSIGPDIQKLENTLHSFGTQYDYLVFGYPPFVKSFVDSTKVNLSSYRLDLVVGGEGISERLRAYLGRHFRSVRSSYGASDLEINIGIETDWTVELRARCAVDPELSRALFGRDTPPMIFQYNPLDYLVETLPEGEMVYTVCRVNGAAPKIRYNLKDQGGTHTWRSLESKLADRGIAAASLAARRGHFPILYVFGRSDLTVPFFGAKVYAADLESAILGDAELASRVRSFQIASDEDEQVNRRLRVALELVPGLAPDAIEADAARLARLFYDGIAESNQDFREVKRMFGPDAIEVELHACGAGPFEGEDMRVKARYIATPGRRPEALQSSEPNPIPPESP